MRRGVAAAPLCKRSRLARFLKGKLSCRFPSSGLLPNPNRLSTRTPSASPSQAFLAASVCLSTRRVSHSLPSPALSPRQHGISSHIPHLRAVSAYSYEYEYEVAAQESEYVRTNSNHVSYSYPRDSPSRTVHTVLKFSSSSYIVTVLVLVPYDSTRLRVRITYVRFNFVVITKNVNLTVCMQAKPGMRAWSGRVISSVVLCFLQVLA